MILDTGNILTKIHRYQLQRPKGTVRVEVHEIVLGSNDKFVAVPIEPLGQKTTKEQFHVQGNTEYEALESLVELIKELPKEEIFPK